MSNRKYKQTLHHVVPSSRRDEGFETTGTVNFKMLRKNYHQNWHALFANKLPHEVVKSVVMVQHNVINKQVRDVIEALTSLPKTDFYVGGVLDYYADDELSDGEITGLRTAVYEKVIALLQSLDVGIEEKKEK